MSDYNTSKPMVTEFFNHVKDGVQLAASMLLLATIVVWFSNEDA